jgi:5-deoxy-glucuronate isomerase
MKMTKKDYYTELTVREGINTAKIKYGLFKFIRRFEIISLNDGKRINLKSKDCEVGLLILKGKCSITIDGKLYDTLGSRSEVFLGNPTAVYIPIETEYEIESHGGVEIAVCSARCDKKNEVAIINPDEITVMQVGRDNWSREVRMMIKPGIHSAHLILGETINPPGNWSGTPAHKHETDNADKESFHEELYYFKSDRNSGFGIQRLYSPERGINELIYLKQNTVTFMPWGYHQIVAGPGYILYYLFFLSGPGNKLIGLADPEHKWINQ